MKMLVIGILFPILVFAAPREVSVQIDGKTYSCLPSGSPIPDPCQQEAKNLKTQFENCSQAYSPAVCVERVFGKVNKSCPEVQQLCFDSCSSAYSQAACYDKCY